ncbi:virulence RhuM family protein [Desulfovibrio sp. OttesenSCG-928-M14]|nr:virulence RhuM family protein [Desulfovibrio sp. OttesenSCG-928-M14]
MTKPESKAPANLPSVAPEQGEFLLYTSEDGKNVIRVRLHGESLWLSQALMAELFQTTKQNIAKHLKAIFADGELQPNSVVNQQLTTAADGKQYRVQYYNLDAILAVGYRVRSRRGVQFRQWATERLSEYLLKGFTMDDERLKNPPITGSPAPDYFDEMLERIRDIRASERRMYLRVREIFALASDYNAVGKHVHAFFQTIQNKLLYAATGRTAPEIIMERADHAKLNMGLTTWRGGVVRKGDITISKNYLNDTEIDELNRIVVMWLDYAEDQAKRRRSVFLKDWDTRLDNFLRFNERNVLPDMGKVSRKAADTHAEAQYELFAARRREALEAAGEEESFKVLEEAAKRLPKAK